MSRASLRVSHALAVLASGGSVTSSQKVIFKRYGAGFAYPRVSTTLGIPILQDPA